MEPFQRNGERDQPNLGIYNSNLRNSLLLNGWDSRLSGIHLSDRYCDLENVSTASAVRWGRTLLSISKDYPFPSLFPPDRACTHNIPKATWGIERSHFSRNNKFRFVATMTGTTREALRQCHREITSFTDPFIAGIPKIELHVHLEGTLTPELRWKLARKHDVTLRNLRSGKVYRSLEEVKSGYYPNLAPDFNDIGSSSFFPDYYDGFNVLRDGEDFYDLAMNYFKRAAAMNVRYCEVFFDPQGHTSRGIPFEVFMPGLKRAKAEAATSLNVRSNPFYMLDGTSMLNKRY